MSGFAKLSSAGDRAFGKYRLVAKLGQGGMADVFLAMTSGLGGFAKLVVVKRLKGIATDDALERTFMDEASIAARLNHPNVVTTNEVGKIDEQFYLCMEYLEGQPLHEIAKRARSVGAAPLAVLLRIICDALTGLHYAHELADYDGSPLNVVHRDVSPQNVFVTYDGTTKVLDFGIAKTSARASHTSTGVVKGKIAYMAPEQALSAPVDRRADVFSVGVMLFELLSGERFWRDHTEVQIVKRLAFGDIPRIEERGPVDSAVAAICDRALAAAPADRYASAAAFRDDLYAYVEEAGVESSTGDVGRVVSELFGDRREELRRIVQEQISETRDPPDPIAEDGAPIAPDDTKGTRSLAVESTQTPRSIDSKTAPSVESALVTTGDALRPVAPPRSRAGGVIALSVAIVAAAALFALSRAKPAARDAAEAASSPVEAPSLIDVRVEVTPREATIYLDDAATSGNPFAAKFALDRTAHKLRVEAPGYRTDVRVVVFDQDRSIDVRLEKAAEPSESATPSSAPSVARPSSRTAPPARRGVKIDTSDPWQ